MAYYFQWPITPMRFSVKRKYFVIKCVINNNFTIEACTTIVVTVHAKSTSREMWLTFFYPSIFQTHITTEPLLFTFLLP